MADILSPLAPVYRIGRYGNLANGVGVTLAETQPGSIVQVAAWPGQDAALRDILKKATGAALPQSPGAGTHSKSGALFAFAPRRYLAVTEAEGLASQMQAMAPEDVGTVTDLTHGRTIIRIAGPKAEWVLSKLFAINFELSAFPEGRAISTNHHEFFAQIQRTGADQFDLYLFRSFARSFWTLLCNAAEETGYEVV